LSSFAANRADGDEEIMFFLGTKGQKDHEKKQTDHLLHSNSIFYKKAVLMMCFDE